MRGTNADDVRSVFSEAFGKLAISGGDPIGGNKPMHQPVTGIRLRAKTILFLGANPKESKRLRLDEEVNKIEKGLERSKRRDQFRIVQKWAVTSDDLRRAMLDHEPEIVHFAGHGTATTKHDSGRDMVVAGSGDQGGLAFEDDTGQVQTIPVEFLAKLLSCAPIGSSALYSIPVTQRIRQMRLPGT